MVVKYSRCEHVNVRVFFTSKASAPLSFDVNILDSIVMKSVVEFLTLREEHRLRVFENRVLMRIFGPKRDEVTETVGNCIMRSFIT
jgi:hypothetical protein